MATRDNICCIPNCTTPTAPILRSPLCPDHARQVYTEVRDMIENATTAQRVASLDNCGKGRARVRNDMRGGFVYFFLVGELVKIGYSTDPEQRLRQVKADRILGYFPGTMRDEKAIHAKFGHLW